MRISRIQPAVKPKVEIAQVQTSSRWDLFSQPDCDAKKEPLLNHGSFRFLYSEKGW